MEIFSQATVIQAAIDIENMDSTQKVRLVDDIFIAQPNLLASVLMLPRLGVGIAQVEVLLHILLVCHQAMKRSGFVWPSISDDLQEKCLERLTARLQATSELPTDLAEEATTKFVDEHPERHLLAFVYGHLRDHDLVSVRTEAEKFLMLTALNLVECLSSSRPHVDAAAAHLPTSSKSPP